MFGRQKKGEGKKEKEKKIHPCKEATDAPARGVIARVRE
jgi:hypothetical protein